MSEYSDGSTSRNLKIKRRSSTVVKNSDCNKSFEFDSNKITGEMGLQITLDERRLVFGYHHDRHLPYIHPNVFAPACMSDVRRMGGGGSGVSVFCGKHRDLGELVMKHGTFKDLEELFALSQISSELKKRGSLPIEKCSSRSEAAQFMTTCLPEFKLVYISPQHVLFKRKMLWGKLRKLIRIGNLVSRVSSSSIICNERDSSGSFISLLTKMREKSDTILHTAKNASPLSSSLSLMSLNDSEFLSPGTSIRIYHCNSGKVTVYLDGNNSNEKGSSLAFVVPKDRIECIHSASVELECSEEFDSFRQIYNDLSPMMTKHLFKFTLAQKKIGGRNATTGAQWLYRGKLNGLTLANLISKFVQTIRNLQTLTLPEEVDVVDKVRNEIQDIKSSNIKADGLSKLADQYMGNSIKKNFDPSKGRIRFLRQTCKEFRDHTIYLEPEEELPAKHLNTLVEPTATMIDVFVDSSTEPPMLFPDKDFWLLIMTVAVTERQSMSPNATKRIWTSGLCDAGIHNLFVSNDHLYFFDLGVPQVNSLPGFMTKFLFSFFHVLGMQEDEENSNEWVNRFIPQGDKLALTKETRQLLQGSYDAFEVSLNRIVDEIFDGDQGLRWLLLQYVTLQLLSDASFCLQRWKMKGGGVPREDNHNMHLEQWLWRALWDTYVAFDINTRESWIRLKIEHPSCEESNSSVESCIRSSIRCHNLNPNKLHDIISPNDEEQEETDKNSFHKNLPTCSPPSPVREIRWRSERLNQQSLRDLTAAAFVSDLNDSDNVIVDHTDDEFDSESSAILPMGFHTNDDFDSDNSAILPVGLHLSEDNQNRSVPSYDKESINNR